MNETRQVDRRELFNQFFTPLPFDVKGTKANPIESRQERRNLARAHAVGAWRKQKKFEV